MAVTAETIESYFKEYQWSYERLDDTHFLSGFDSEVTDTFPIFVTLTPSWIYFAIVPFVKAPQDPECERVLHGHLLRLCQEINMAKFSVDPDGDVILTVELPRENLDYSEFSDALGALSYYADQTYPTVYALATDPTAVSSFLEEKDLDWGDG
jgi:hypothetical protein